MPTAPDLPAVKAYLSSIGTISWTDPQITQALESEITAQANKVRFPVDPEPPAEALPYPADLADALCRRVARNLALRALPLGVQANITDGAVATTRIGGLDAEIREKEAPYRKKVMG
jgi:hypothetical protein